MATYLPTLESDSTTLRLLSVFSHGLLVPIMFKFTYGYFEKKAVSG